MPSEAQIAALIKAVVKDTLDERVSWTATSGPESLHRGTDTIIDEFFQAEFEGQTIAVFERKYREYDGDRDDLYWTGQVRFAFISGSRVLWETGDEAARLWTLLKLARESASDVNSLIGDLLARRNKRN